MAEREARAALGRAPRIGTATPTTAAESAAQQAYFLERILRNCVTDFTAG
jgi:hypothetical protein